MTEAPDLWAKAREGLPDDVQEWLSGFDAAAGGQPSPTNAQFIDGLISQAEEKQEELEKNRHKWSVKAGKHKLELRPLFDSMIKWLDKFKSIGDLVSSFDPVHAALPWAAFRFVLQHLVAEQEHSDKFVKLLAAMPRLLFTGRIFEMVYSNKSMDLDDEQEEIQIGFESLEHLRQELVDLYSRLLSGLHFCYSIFTKTKTMRKVAAIFNSSKPGEILAQLEEQLTRAIESGDNCKRLSISRILVHIDEIEWQRTLRAISNIPFQTHHDDVSHRRTTGTCDWITGRKEFRRWMRGSCSVIVLYGIPGAGKTFLTSKVIDFVIDSIKEYGESNEAVAFFYCKRDEDNRRNPRHILQSILRQLSSDAISDKCKIHPALEGLPDELERRGKTFDFFTCKELIKEIIGDYSRTTIILDALDECDRESRQELMAAFDELIQGNANIRIFLSSRTDDDIRRHFQSRPVIEMQTTDNEDDISVFVHDRLSRDRRWDALEPNLRHEIKQVFREKSQGMFQWAALQIQQLNRLSVWSESNISNHLEIAPKGLEAAYDVVWGQIQDMPRGQVSMAQRAFLWVVCAFEPLQTAELSCMPAFEALIDAGADVNQIDLSLSRDDSPQFSKSLGIDTPLKAAMCAASYDLRGRWPISAPISAWHGYRRHFDHPGHFDGKNEGYKFVDELLHNKALVDMETDHGSALELAAKHLNTEDAIILLNELQIIPRPDLLSCLAAENEMADLEYFIERLGVDVNCQWEGISPLMRATRARNTRGVRQLLRLGAKFELASKRDQEMVCIGAYMNDWEDDETGVLDLLFASDFDINATDGESSLLYTFIMLYPERTEAIQELIYAGANVNQILPRSRFRTALSLAAGLGYLKLFEALLDAGADPALDANTGVGNALASAAFSGELDICRMLLDRKLFDVNAAQGGFFSNVLFALIDGHTIYLSERDLGYDTSGRRCRFIAV
ncbi:hypothetical protein CcaCcLH18_14102 [Colletotrichum camelliae]|nr:hypothetical protein CcaCcLH18_14102 [Colletotrichum camelliae]